MEVRWLRFSYIVSLNFVWLPDPENCVRRESLSVDKLDAVRWQPKPGLATGRFAIYTNCNWDVPQTPVNLSFSNLKFLSVQPCDAVSCTWPQRFWSRLPYRTNSACVQALLGVVYIRFTVVSRLYSITGPYIQISTDNCLSCVHHECF